MSIDEQIALLHRQLDYCEYMAKRAQNSFGARERFRHEAGEWLAIENSLRELRSRRAGEWVDD